VTQRLPSLRAIGDLTSADLARSLKETSILCWPLGAIEQHGPHLPLATDVLVAEGLTRAILARWGDQFDLWQIPTLPVGLSREHDWAPGTLSLSVETFAALFKSIAQDLVRALPARNLVILNGHGGNRGILEALLHELRGDLGVNACVIHPFDLSKVRAGAGPDVHGGAAETSVMLALAPDLVRSDRIAAVDHAPHRDAIAALVFERGVTWPWCTDDPRLGQAGIIGDPRGASAELGRSIVESVVTEAGGVLARLLENQALMRKT
jgi:creatinine amidohydrolase